MKTDLPKLARKLSNAYGYRIRILGPYLCKDGRKRIDIRGAPERSGLNKTIQLARARLEVLLGRPLRKGETVDHIDHDKTNDSYSNVQLLSHVRNARKRSVEAKLNAAKSSRTGLSRKSNSVRNTGDLNPAAKLSNGTVKKIRKKFDITRDFDSLLEEVPLKAKSLLECLAGKTYKTAEGPIFLFAKNKAGRGKKPIIVVGVEY